MEPIALEHAQIKLQKAERSLDRLKEADNFKDAEEAWSDFLLAAATIYSKFEQGSKGNNKSQEWYGRKKKERKDDPLLRYLHQARNSDEHGIERVVARGGNKTGFGGHPLKFGERVPVTIKALDKNMQPFNTPETTSDGFLDGPSLRLVTVHDRRYGDHCDPPMQHLGKQIEPADNFVYGVGFLGLTYFKSLVAEAASLFSNPTPMP
jgi:hypothetical protein